ncbi:hypothetical protein MA16_Dca019058 [Dendrobium catenatum]|uniref:GRF-type domain-containing protein n=1 Tax=Dendrobium catenatum TaxID=906689 RepID=A0A2I0W299_9ASPA|nr:hypothetical protein MA16_Dca019058 [Dendrobium catenatum]
MSSSNSSVVRARQHQSLVYCHCHLKCVLFTCPQGPNSGRQFYRCIYNRSDDDCHYFKWVDEEEEPCYVTCYEFNAFDRKTSKKLDRILLMIKVFVAVVLIDVTIRLYFG